MTNPRPVRFLIALGVLLSMLGGALAVVSVLGQIYSGLPRGPASALLITLGIAFLFYAAWDLSR